jgi:CRISP-associated protein Cas1
MLQIIRMNTNPEELDLFKNYQNGRAWPFLFTEKRTLYMGWKTVIIGSESKVSLSLNKLKITIGNEFQNIPLGDIDSVIFSHSRVVMTIPILSALVENNINVIICDDRNDPIGIFQPFNGHSLVFKKLNAQINWKITRKKKLWKRIVELKIQSEIDALRLEGRSETVIEQLKEYRDSVYTDDQTNREAASARLYFQTTFGSGFTRDVPCTFNAALNYGYKIVASYVSKCIASRGLITQLGIHHIGESNPFNLTYDFIEPFRAIIDLWVVENVMDVFNAPLKQEVIGILNYKVYVDEKWMRLNDAIEDIVDSYIAYLEERTNDVLSIDLSKGIKIVE